MLAEDMTMTPSQSSTAQDALADAPSLTADDRRELLRRMLLHRQIDTRGFQLNRQGRIPFALGGEGHEAAQAGASLAFSRGKDVFVPYYRDLGLSLGIGLPLIEVFNSLFARNADRSGGRQFPSHFSRREIGLVSVSSIIAAQVAHAVGIAFAMQYRNETGRAVLCSFGDGATSQGEWHEAVNFAAVHRSPVVFFCQNNEWAISVPISQQMAIRNIADRAVGYGIAGVIVDGFDPEAVYRVVWQALERARTGGGPTLVEAKCYRFLSHTTDDDDRTYRSRAEVEQRRAKDPVPVYEHVLLEDELLGAADIDDLKKRLFEEIDEALEAAAASPEPTAADLFSNVYAGAYQPWL